MVNKKVKIREHKESCHEMQWRIRDRTQLMVCCLFDSPIKKIKNLQLEPRIDARQINGSRP